ncbi:MAG TPA: PKD domain-containing protein [Saprospiraceae bacterium]|nr:PKD domain-containing protein [Saprospiraceae bacterium]HMP23115.1 PKD domain-containing protein [Saprospiraceae bacterium]
MNRIFLILLWCCVGCLSLAQTTPERTVDFIARPQGSALVFEPITPPLLQIAGAPAAFYEYYWEFGDGNFRFAKNPTHVYADTGRYEVYLLATGKYDNGKAPKSRKKETDPPKEKPKTAVADAGSLPTALDAAWAPLGMRSVRNPRAGEETVCILTYANRTPTVQSGKLYLFYNQKAYPHEHFRFQEARTHFGERAVREELVWQNATETLNGWAGLTPMFDWYATSLPNQPPDEALRSLRAIYKTARVWSFDGLQPSETRNFFVSLDATNQMIADTNAIISMTALLLSDDQRVVETYNLEMEIVASHDPNYIAVDRRRMSFRGIRNKSLTYKVHFQNTGEGPASTIQITTDVPSGLRTDKLQVLDWYPKCLLCPEPEVPWSCLDTTRLKEQLIFTFRNIYLPGTQQADVTDTDSTNGFVKYRLVPERRIRKERLDARASIVFDRNPPIVTNRAKTAFRAGLSPGIMAGWTFFPNASERNYLSLGLSLSPFKPSKAFLQWEFWTGLPGETIFTQTGSIDTIRFVEEFPQFAILVDSITTVGGVREIRPVYFSIVPVQVRKNLSDWLAAGAGLLLHIDYQRIEANEFITRERRAYDLQLQREIPDLYRLYPEENVQRKSQEVSFRPVLFADVHLGRVRQGPAVGLRGFLPLEKEANWYAALFAAWKF